MKSKLTRLVLLLILAVLLIPYPTTSIPEWRIRVVDEKGSPLAKVEVLQNWTNGGSDYSEIDSKVSDSQGYVTFPPRRKILPIGLRFFAGIINLISYVLMPHGAETGGRARISAKEGSSLDWLYYYEDGKMSDALIIR